MPDTFFPPSTEPVDPALAAELTLPEFPRSAGYDPLWQTSNMMGPSALWLLESIVADLDLQPGMRVLDLGCGRALTSIFLAREFGVQVWATDLWIAASENWTRIQQAGMEHQVFPIHAEAHDLPYADAYFDAVVSIDAYHYFGTDDLYLPYLARFLRPEGKIGIVVPGLTAEFEGNHPPTSLQPYWEYDWWTFHSPGWWQRHVERTGFVTVERADLIPDGWRHWLIWTEICNGLGFRPWPEGIRMLTEDAGQTIGFTRLVGRRIETES
ncbi:MAG TPA: methyltransferase domain-containing protein [Thermomicrobiales bacterium]|nr:methyltransferase domain-containing protein [Thermomicrobiales bacterium]HRA47637.1 methyltransferase domain-containing protein [Thermomicrobiales bacterium]